MYQTLAKINRRGLKLLNIMFFAEIPMGLMSWRYLLPSQDNRLKLHRHFWWHSAWRLAGPLGILLQAWLYSRWLLGSGWYRCFQVTKRLAPEITQREGITFKSQLIITLKLCLGYCIHPRDVYRFELYKHPEQALDYIYDRETQSFHTWQSLALGTSPQKSLEVIQDKIALENQLRELNIPVVNTVQFVTAKKKTPLLSLMHRIHQDKLFCKTRSGNQGLGAFAAWKTEAGLVGRTFQGHDLENTAAVEKAWQALLQRDEALVQPLLTNHPILAPMAFGDEVITVRYISQVQTGIIHVLSATIEVPAERNVTTQLIQYIILPIDPDTGIIQNLPEHRVQSEQIVRLYNHVKASGPQHSPLPYWQNLVKHTHAGHQQFLDIATLAWDWVITPIGPVLLEGNSGWGTATPQLLRGGFLANLTNPE
jgi:hypothetical protein